ncbi:MAG TPA: hypothetical protein PLE16_06110 [Spirochaetota bacterium]|nr:hypothetical protein [Spirochaetota bacterium]HOH36348.1 hypothetical protein [Spirochaetota bacterium]HPM34157.1 hypothetical protein [Spirochaetota bacterium]HPW51214.1 hypothetical protein [Spirochaetota bacterium]HPY01768.1 hypothetical protein [Spirochaetota bacterium]
MKITAEKITCFIEEETRRVKFGDKYSFYIKERTKEILAKYKPYFAFKILPPEKSIYGDTKYSSAVFALTTGLNSEENYDDYNKGLIDDIIASTLTYYALYNLKNKLLSENFTTGTLLTPGNIIPIEKSAEIFSIVQPDQNLISINSKMLMYPRYSLNGIYLNDGKNNSECNYCKSSKCLYKNITARMELFMKNAGEDPAL